MSDHRQTTKSRHKTIDSFFSKLGDQSTSNTPIDKTSCDEVHSSKLQRVETGRVDVSSFVMARDPGLRKPIWMYDVNQQDEVRRAYIDMGPCQPKLDEYKKIWDGNQFCRFQYPWFAQFSWLEYSIAKNKAFCFPCFIFDRNSSKFKVFTVDGFDNWKRVNNGKLCKFKHHEGEDNSLHKLNVQKWDNLKCPSQQIDQVMIAQSSQQVVENRLRLKTSIETVKWLAKQACAFRGHDESSASSNRGNFIEMIKFLAGFNENINKVVLTNAPGNSKFTSPAIQKEILKILADKIKKKIREEVGDSKYCILVDEALDESNQEQMAIILRFVDYNGFIRERFFGVVGVEDTTAITLKTHITEVLTKYNLQIADIRGQGYDGASNMHGAWNGLQSLFLNDCPYAYYIHCFAHRLQLALVAASKDVHDVWLFFSKLNLIINLVSASPKRHFELKSAREIEIAELLSSRELETGIGANQIRTLTRPGATRWSSHFDSVNKLIDMFGPTCIVLENLFKNGLNNNIRGEAKGALKAIRSFEFVFILQLMNEVMGITDMLCQALQRQSQDILNALHLVRSTKILLHELRQDGWGKFFSTLVSFCERQGIDIPDMSTRYIEGTGRSCQQQDHVTVDHYYHVDVFNAVIDFQLMELGTRFPEQTVELLTLSSALDPTKNFESFNIDDICSLAENYYHGDFPQKDLDTLRRQLQHYKNDVLIHAKFQNITSLSELCQVLSATRKSQQYFLIDKLIRLVLTLPISTASTERAFSAMKLVKTSLRNKMDNEFLENCMVVYIEREIADTIDSDLVIDAFASLKPRKSKFK